MTERERLISLLRCPSCKGTLAIAGAAVCERGHRFEVRDEIPILVADNEPKTSEAQHAHQREFYGKVFRPGRPYLLENWQKAYLQRISLLWPTRGDGSPFLDSGAGGDAYAVLEAARRGIPAVGCDLAFEAMQSARQFAIDHGLADQCLFVVASAESLPFADGAFGSCVSIAVLEHVPDDMQAIAEVSRVTRSRGRVYFTVPNSLALMPAPLRPFYRRHDRWVGHLRHYTAEDLASKCSAVGLAPLKTVYSAHWSKVLQLGLDVPLKKLRIPHDRLWWWFEGFDTAVWDRPDGLHLNLLLERGRPETA